MFKHYDPEIYPKYDNYDVINVDKVKDIPCDYNGVMGVPITFLEKHNPDQFEIVAFRKGNDGQDLVYTLNNSKERESATVLPSIGATTQMNFLSSLETNSPVTEEFKLTAKLSTDEYSFATAIPGLIKNTEGKIGDKITYARVLIRKK